MRTIRALAFALMGSAAAMPAAARPDTPPPPSAAPAPGGSASAATRSRDFTPLDLPSWIILEDAAAAKTQPWILVVDDPQCPYCMQLHLAVEKAREGKDAELVNAVIARLPFPLAFHDQSAHIVMDAFCLEASRAGHSWSAAAYLDWLMVEPWKAEPEWKGTTVEDLVKDGGFFDTKYDAHKVTSSRRRDYQTESARAEADACAAEASGPAAAGSASSPWHPATCHGDADCEKLCTGLRDCRTACPAAGGPAPKTPPAGGATPPSRDDCLAACSSKFAGTRYRQYSKVHSACLLEEGASSAHEKTAAATAWATDHKVPGTPTIYAGHPSIGFRLLGDSDSLVEFLAELKSALADARSRMAASAKAATRGR